MPSPLTPLPQHLALVDWLRREEKEVWRWFGDKETAAMDAGETRLSLLRDMYRMDAEGHPDVFREISRACAALGVQAEVHAYQAQHETQPNAAVYHLPGEAHVVFSGPILSLLSAEELRGVIGHELAHHLLWQMNNGEFLLADRILHAAAAHPGAEPAHARSARVWRLATELFADRGAFLASGSLEAAVGGLVKATTGLANVNAKSYLSQAKEVFSKSKPKIDQVSHPETFIRARALQLWVEEDDSLEETIDRMLDSDDDLDGLTLLQQAELSMLTRRFLAHLLAPYWFQTEATMAHARLFFQDFSTAPDPGIIAEIAARPVSQREYCTQLMLDFCAVDPDLHDAPIARGLSIARDLECLGAFEKMLGKALNVKAKDLKRLKETQA
jgi:Zn-dependent protease with chaperone function